MRSFICHWQFLVLLLSLQLFSQKKITKDYIVDGRAKILADKSVLLIGSASSVSYNFEGDSFGISLASSDSSEHQNYISVEIDGEYAYRLKIEKGFPRVYKIEIPVGNKLHNLVLFKATEAANGNIIVKDPIAKLLPPSPKSKKKIEFIGDSITCGMGNDTTGIQCGAGDWFDQHNAYWSYASVLSRSLDVDFMLSSVSGIGMYRNWNDEHKEEAIMPEVYEKLMLKKTDTTTYDFSFQPDIVSICLGTNDLSDGDGKKPRLPFSEEKYVNNYIRFINTVYKHSPNTRIVLLTSPMVSGTKNGTLVKCLTKVIAAFKTDKLHPPIALFEFKPMQPNGCGYHPDIEDDKLMAAQLEGFFKTLLDEK